MEKLSIEDKNGRESEYIKENMPELVKMSSLDKKNQTFEVWYTKSLKKLEKNVRNKNRKTSTKEVEALFSDFSTKKQELKDWSGSIIDVCSFHTAKQALEASHNWHDAMSKLGDGKFYGPIDPDCVVFKFNDGWTLQMLETENDYQVEGNLMNHCIASYHSNESKVLSLRDKHNLPHVTIEMCKDMMVITQSSGKCNNEVSDKYNVRIKLWYADHCMKDGIKAKILSSADSAYKYAIYFKKEYEQQYREQLKDEGLTQEEIEAKIAKRLAGPSD